MLMDKKMVSYQFNNSRFQEREAVIISEIYFKDVWRIGVVGNGFDVGIKCSVEAFRRS